MITADTITDEQIEHLRGPAAESGEGYIDADGDYVPTAVVLEWCDNALSDPESDPLSFEPIRRRARGKLAEILNSRTVQP